MVKNHMINKCEEAWGNKYYKKIQDLSEKGRQILREILGPYELLFKGIMKPER